MVDITDGETAEVTVASPTIEISINGAAYAAPNDGTWAEISDGDYTVTLDDTDSASTGWILLRVEKATVSMESKVLILVGLDPGDQVVMAENIRLLKLQGR